MYLLYADYGREGEASVYISQSKHTLESIIVNVKFHENVWWENEGNWEVDEEYKLCVPELIADIIKKHIRSTELKIKEIKEV
jgi:hypothetical protein